MSATPYRSLVGYGRLAVVTHHVPGGTMSRDQIAAHLAFAAEHFAADDPYERAHAFSCAGRAYESLALHQDDEMLRTACQQAALRYEMQAARVRFDYGIPTTRPKTEAELLGIRFCESCRRPWQIPPGKGSCPDCPVLLFGPTPTTAAEVGKYPAPTLVDVTKWSDHSDE